MPFWHFRLVNFKFSQPQWKKLPQFFSVTFPTSNGLPHANDFSL